MQFHNIFGANANSININNCTNEFEGKVNFVNNIFYKAYFDVKLILFNSYCVKYMYNTVMVLSTNYGISQVLSFLMCQMETSH